MNRIIASDWMWIGATLVTGVTLFAIHALSADPHPDEGGQAVAALVTAGGCILAAWKVLRS